MTRRLVVFGCSNAYGHGLPDCHRDGGRPGPKPSNWAWPSLVRNFLQADGKQIEVDNKGMPGASNKRIWHNALLYPYKKTDTVVILWSYLVRYAILHDETLDPQVDWRSNFLIHNARTNAEKVYFEEIWNEYDATISSIGYINHIHYMLKEDGISSYHVWQEIDPLPEQFKKYLPKDINFKCYPIHGPENLLDLGLDNRHPGIESHKKLAKEMWHWIR